ncbi:hypothetical protein A8C32_04240 [Flavivirga aquatica]|uniref:Uncharacterized protein n=1 Tax=Flavivirga aquatica TaxID=1849968 RepID=A0A1E5TBD6_9FLAO|nr:hypothetical protein [Flavivirga aquatica]OEK08666.1 hypothetical protein A8C32_04240 [Flavivirga aquatica]
MRFLSKYLKKFKDKKELKKSNFGRDYGWYIEYEGKIVGELVDWKFTDMFWCSYKVVSICNEWEHILFDEKLWQNCEFKFKNKKHDKYAENAFSGFTSGSLIETKTVGMRMLYFTEL